MSRRSKNEGRKYGYNSSDEERWNAAFNPDNIERPIGFSPPASLKGFSLKGPVSAADKKALFMQSANMDPEFFVHNQAIERPIGFSPPASLKGLSLKGTVSAADQKALENGVSRTGESSKNAFSEGPKGFSPPDWLKGIVSATDKKAIASPFFHLNDVLFMNYANMDPAEVALAEVQRSIRVILNSSNADLEKLAYGPLYQQVYRAVYDCRGGQPVLNTLRAELRLHLKTVREGILQAKDGAKLITDRIVLDKELDKELSLDNEDIAILQTVYYNVLRSLNVAKTNYDRRAAVISQMMSFLQRYMNHEQDQHCITILNPEQDFSISNDCEILFHDEVYNHKLVLEYMGAMLYFHPLDLSSINLNGEIFMLRLILSP